MVLPDDVFLVEDATNDEADWDDDRPEAEPPPGVSAEPIDHIPKSLLSQLQLPKDHIMTWDDTVISMMHDSKEALFVEQLMTYIFISPRGTVKSAGFLTFKLYTEPYMTKCIQCR